MTSISTVVAPPPFRPWLTGSHLVVALALDKSVTRYNEFDISNKVGERGWILSVHASRRPRGQRSSHRVRPHLNSKVASILADDIERACDFLEKHGGNATPPKLHDPHKSSPA
jgi:glutamate decarboxylase